MALESVTNIADLVITNPTATDAKSEGDDHIRNIKKALKTDLPNITGPITATQAELNVLDGITASTAELNLLDGVTATTAEINHIDGVTSPIQTQLDGKQPLDADLTAIAGLSSAGMVARTGAGTASVRTLTAGAGITITNGDGVSGNPTIAVNASDLPNSAAVVSYTPAGTGAVATTVQAALREWVTVTNYLGVDPTGVLDSSAGLQYALDSGAKRVRIPAGTYKIGYTLTIPDGVSIEGDGVGVTILDGSGATYANLTNGDHIRTAGGTLTAIPDLSANVSKGGRTLTFASAPTLVPGDLIVIYNPTDFSFSGFRDYYRAGEMVRVAKVSGSTVTIQGTLADSYTAADVDVYRLDGASSCHLRGFTLNGLSGAVGTVTGLDLVHLLDSSIEDVRVTGCSYAQVVVANSFNVELRNVVCEEDFSADSGTDYGLVIANSQNIKVNGGYYCAARHGVTTGGASAVGDVTCRYIYIHGATVSTTGTVQAADFHGNTEYAWLDNCVVDGGFAGGGDFIYITNNQFKGEYGNGDIAMYFGEFRGCNLTVSGNTIWNNEVQTARGAFIDIGGNDNVISPSTLKGGIIRIDGNTMLMASATESSNQNGIRVFNRSYNGSEPIEVHITNNTIQSTTGSRQGLVQVAEFDSAGSSRPWDCINISDNTLGGYSINVSHSTASAYVANKVIVQNNNINKNNAAAGINVADVKDYVCIKGNHVTLSGFQGIIAQGQTGMNTRHIDVSDNVLLDTQTISTGTSTTNVGALISLADYATVQNNTTGSFNEYIRVASITGFVIGETITGGTSGATATITGFRTTTDIQIERTRSGSFTIGETVTGGTSAASSTVSIAQTYGQSSRMRFDAIGNLFVANNNDLRLTTDSVGTITNYLPGSVLTGSATYNPASLVDGAGVTTTVTVTGAALGDHVTASFALDLQGITMTAWVSAADTVSVRFQNETGGPIDLGSGSLRARVTKL